MSILTALQSNSSTPDPEWEGKRFRPCSCGACGILFDTKADLGIANFTGPQNREQPINQELRQAYMKHTARALNAYDVEFKV